MTVESPAHKSRGVDIECQKCRGVGVVATGDARSKRAEVCPRCRGGGKVTVRSCEG